LTFVYSHFQAITKPGLVVEVPSSKPELATGNLSGLLLPKKGSNLGKTSYHGTAC